jgi:hypothetical protein
MNQGRSTMLSEIFKCQSGALRPVCANIRLKQVADLNTASVLADISSSLLLARLRHVDRIGRCLLSGAKRKTSARSEYFRV